MAKKEATQTRGLVSTQSNLTTFNSFSGVMRRQVDTGDHYFQGACSTVLGLHQYYSKNVLGESEASAEQLMDLVKANIESIIPGGRTRCSKDEPLKLGDRCSLTPARYQVKTIDVTPTSFTLKLFSGTLFAAQQSILSRKRAILYT